jgi:hypothetical protein
LNYGSPGSMIIQRSRKPGGRQGCVRIQLISVRARGALPHSPAVKQSLPPMTRSDAV